MHLLNLLLKIPILSLKLINIPKRKEKKRKILHRTYNINPISFHGFRCGAKGACVWVTSTSMNREEQLSSILIVDMKLWVSSSKEMVWHHIIIIIEVKTYNIDPRSQAMVVCTFDTFFFLLIYHVTYVWLVGYFLHLYHIFCWLMAIPKSQPHPYPPTPISFHAFALCTCMLWLYA